MAFPVAPIGALALVTSATTTLDELRAIALASTVGQMLMAVGSVLIIIGLRNH